MDSSGKAIKSALSGIRALELAEIWAGPFCGVLLGDMGAEVIKVEAVQRIARGAISPAPVSHGYPDMDPGKRPWNRSGAFNAVNRNKKGVTLDLTRPAGVERFKELVSVSDVVFTNYAFGVMDKFGLGYEELRKVKPDIIALFTPGFGNTGPYRGFRSMGMVIDAITGHTALRGYPDMDLSHNSLVHHPDAVAGVSAMFGICMAIRNRARTGRGQFIDLSQAESFMPHLGEVFMQYGLTGQARPRRGNSHPRMAPHGVYRCVGDDQWVTISVRTQEEWVEMCGVMEMPQLIRNPKFETLDARLRNSVELDDIIGRWTRELGRYEVAEALQARGIPSGPVLDCGGDTYDDPHLQERGFFQAVEHPEAGVHLYSGPIWKMANRSDARHEPTPGLGEHNDWALGELLGVDDGTLVELELQNIIGTAPLEGADMGGVRRAAEMRKQNNA